ncbi:hypothetical protein QTP88_002542 [Uroleucon formosanum]
MPSYSNIELADMHFIYGLCNGNTRASQREYENRFPHQRVPAPVMFRRIHQALRERGTFRRSSREGIRNVDLETEILDEVNRNPETSTRVFARQFGVHYSTVWKTLNTEGLYPYHYLRDCGVLQSILWTDESTFTREGVFNVHNSHHYAQENPRLVRQQRFQRRFSINVWMGIIDGVLIGPLLGLPRTVGGNTYLHFLQNELPGLLEELPLELRRCRGSLITVRMAKSSSVHRPHV